MATKLTLKNQLVYDYFRKHLNDDEMINSVKAVFYAYRSDIVRRFGIDTYATFNMHVRKAREWENETGNKVTVIRMDNKGVESPEEASK